ncbi:MAG: hypothetical protein P9X27_04205 [Candidatus Kaelpia aquatica]|nr:hypothetical protein [Candidatus Kaelpia aquatica]
MKNLINIFVAVILFTSQLVYAAGEVIENREDQIPELGRLVQIGIMLGVSLMDSEVEEPNISTKGDSVVFDAGEILIIDSPNEVVMMVGSDIIQYEQDTIKIWSGRPYNVEAVKENLIQDLDATSLGSPTSKIEFTGVLDMVRSVSLNNILAIGDGILTEKNDNFLSLTILAMAATVSIPAMHRFLSSASAAGVLGFAGIAISVAAATGFIVGVFVASAGYALYHAATD